jgi:hypothetical protein
VDDFLSLLGFEGLKITEWRREGNKEKLVGV